MSQSSYTYFEVNEGTPMASGSGPSWSVVQAAAFGALVGAACFGAVAYTSSNAQLSIATPTIATRATTMPVYGRQYSARTQDTSLAAVVDERPLNLDELSSRVDRPIVIPDKVKVDLKDGVFTAEGPHGKLTREVPPQVSIRQEGPVLMVYYDPTQRNARAFFGLYQALLKNMVKGVSEKFEKKMEMIGVGYRARVDGKNLVLLVGKSHDVIMPIPEGIEVKVEENTKLSIIGIDNEAVGQFCANIRKQRPPEPYKGKGIRFQGEQIILKDGKK